jgi:hypothetical protein
MQELVAADAYLRELAAANPNVEVRQMRTGCHHQQVVRVDDRMFVSLIMYSEATRRCPLVECNAQSTFFAAMANEFDGLWDANAETSSAPATKPAPPDGQAARAETP